MPRRELRLLAVAGFLPGTMGPAVALMQTHGLTTSYARYGSGQRHMGCTPTHPKRLPSARPLLEGVGESTVRIEEDRPYSWGSWFVETSILFFPLSQSEMILGADVRNSHLRPSSSFERCNMADPVGLLTLVVSH